MTNPISINELILLTGSTESAALLQYMLDANTNMLAELLDVTQFDKHDITDERLRVYEQYLYTEQLPINSIDSIKQIDGTVISVDTIIDGLYTVITQKDGKDYFIAEHVLNENYIYRRHLPDVDIVTITYNAGWQLEEIISVDVNPVNDETLDITDAGTTTTYTFKSTGPTGDEILIGVDEDATAVNIAAKLGGSSVASLVTLPVGSTITATSKITVNTSANFPSDLKMALSMMVNASLLDKTVSAGEQVKSYSVGSKTVQYMSNFDQRNNSGGKSSFEILLKKYCSSFRRSHLLGW